MKRNLRREDGLSWFLRHLLTTFDLDTFLLREQGSTGIIYFQFSKPGPVKFISTP